MNSLHSLEELFSKFPGIGPRQAKRFVYYLLNKSPSYIKEFTRLVEEVKKGSTECERCHRFFVIWSNNFNAKNVNMDDSNSKNSGGKICSICADPTRDASTLMVVARDSDFETVEKSGFYKGLYFILGGTIPVLDKEPDKRIRLKGLLEEVTKKLSSTGKLETHEKKSEISPIDNGAKLKEIILSLNATPDGEHTADIVRDALSRLEICRRNNVAFTVLGRGLSTGAELEYVDRETIKNALQNRH